MTQMPTQTDTPAASLVGALREFVLPDVLRLLAAGHHTGEVLVVAGGTDGRLWMRGGDLNGSAVRGTGSVAQAVFELSLVEDGWFYFTAGRTAPEPVPAVAVADVLATVLPQVAEWRDLLRRVPLDATVHIAPAPPGANVQLTADQWQVLAAVGSHGMRVVDLVAATGRDQVDTVRSLRDMVDKGLVVVTGGTAPPARPLSVEPAPPPPPVESYPIRARHAGGAAGRPGSPANGTAGAGGVGGSGGVGRPARVDGLGGSGATIVVASAPSSVPLASATTPAGTVPAGGVTSTPAGGAPPTGTATHAAASAIGVASSPTTSAQAAVAQPAVAQAAVAHAAVAQAAGIQAAGIPAAGTPAAGTPEAPAEATAPRVQPASLPEDSLVPLAMARNVPGGNGQAAPESFGGSGGSRTIASDPPLPPMPAGNGDDQGGGSRSDGTVAWPAADTRTIGAEVDAAGA